MVGQIKQFLVLRSLQTDREEEEGSTDQKERGTAPPRRTKREDSTICIKLFQSLKKMSFWMVVLPRSLFVSGGAFPFPPFRWCCFPPTLSLQAVTPSSLLLGGGAKKEPHQFTSITNFNP